jgi:fumarate hydratase subunit beta
MKTIQTPLKHDELQSLHAKDFILFTGVLYTARDAAHLRLIKDIENNTPPFELEGAVIYYVGPSPTPPGQKFGSAGPTTSSRMDVFTPTLLDHGVKAIIGKGYRSKVVLESFKSHQAVYLLAIGGSGAYLGQCVESSEVIAYEDLGPESIKRLVVKDLPLIVGYDVYGEDAYVYAKTL